MIKHRAARLRNDGRLRFKMVGLTWAASHGWVGLVAMFGSVTLCSSSTQSGKSPSIASPRYHGLTPDPAPFPELPGPSRSSKTSHCVGLGIELVRYSPSCLGRQYIQGCVD